MILLILKNELKLKKVIFITTILSLIVLGSYISTHSMYENLLNLSTSNATDLNLESLNGSINSFNGLTYFFEFLFSNDLILIFFLFFSIISLSLFGVNLIKDINNGRGNLLVSRIGFKKYLNNYLIAQSIFNYTYLTIFFTILFWGSYLLYGNYNLSQGLGVNETQSIIYENIFIYFIIMIIKIIIFATIVNIITILGTLSFGLLKNKYILQLFPLLYYFVTLFIGSILVNYIKGLNYIFSVYILDILIDNIMGAFILTNRTPLLQIPIFLLTMVSLIILLYIKNIKKFERDYLLCC